GCSPDRGSPGETRVLPSPLMGNYGVPADEPVRLNRSFESERIHIAGLVALESCAEASHRSSRHSLDRWLQGQKVPGLAGVDTRALTQKLRTAGTMLGKLVYGEQRIDFWDPNEENLVARVSVRTPEHYGSGDRRVVLVDCGCKNNIIRSLQRRGVAVTVVPWDWPVYEERCAGVVLSNGPGDPTSCAATVRNVRRLLERDTPTF